MKKVTTTNQTWEQMREQGYTQTRTAYTRGYISRFTDVDKQPVKISGTGEMFYEAPAFDTTQFHLRVYIAK